MSRKSESIVRNKDGLKWCSTCKKWKEESEFYKSKRSKDGLDSCCKQCDSEREKRRYFANVEESRKRNMNRSYKYNCGITIDDYNKMFEQQSECCAICHRHQSEFKRSLFVDHNHETGKIRGLLCFDCNLVLGRAKDSIKILESAVEYLKVER